MRSALSSKPTDLVGEALQQARSQPSAACGKKQVAVAVYLITTSKMHFLAVH